VNSPPIPTRVTAAQGDAYPVRVQFSPGDLLFVAKGESHRFENHTPDTAVWVIFGPGA